MDSEATQVKEETPREVGPHYNDATNQQIRNNFTHHPPAPPDLTNYAAIRSKARDLADFINDWVPNSREKSLALTELENSVMWANAGIARNS